jgi:GT2 family glycosyltransferase
MNFSDYECVNLEPFVQENLQSIPVMIYPVLNRFDLLEKSLKSIDYPIDEILIINNSGNENETAHLQNKFLNLNLKILNLPSNIGISGSWNLGIKLYPHAKYWLFGSADTFPTPGTLKEFAIHSQSDRAVFAKDVQYNLFSIGENIVAEVGLFDEYIYPAYYEDEDYTDRFYIKGFKIHILPNGNIEKTEISQSIKSNENFLKRNDYTYVQNHHYYWGKRSSGDYACKGWDLTRRRDHEWL